MAKGTLTEQLAEFQESLRLAGMKRPRRPKSWMDAFHMLSDLISGMNDKGKKIVFIDELPWMDTPRSNLISALEHFWNGWASARKDIVLIICGSATAWIQKKILNSYGGLHNRVNIKLRRTAFRLDTKTKKAVHNTLVTTYGLRKNSHSDIVKSVVTMDDLFKEE